MQLRRRQRVLQLRQKQLARARGNYFLKISISKKVSYSSIELQEDLTGDLSSQVVCVQYVMFIINNDNYDVHESYTG